MSDEKSKSGSSRPAVLAAGGAYIAWAPIAAQLTVMFADPQSDVFKNIQQQFRDKYTGANARPYKFGNFVSPPAPSSGNDAGERVGLINDHEANDKKRKWYEDVHPSNWVSDAEDPDHSLQKLEKVTFTNLTQADGKAKRMKYAIKQGGAKASVTIVETADLIDVTIFCRL